MSKNVYVIEEVTGDDVWIVGYHDDLKTAENYLDKLKEIDSLNCDGYYFIQEVADLEDIGYLNGEFEEYEIDDDWDDYDESWDEYHGMYDTDFEPFAKMHRNQKKLDEWN